MLNELVVGPQQVANGATVPARSDKSRAQVIVQGHAAYQEAVDIGNVYGVCNQTGVTSQAGISATTPVLTLYNPLGSQRNLAIWYVGCTFQVVFAAVATVFVCVGSDIQTAAVTGTLTTAHRNMKVGLSQNPAARTFLAATLPVAPVAIGLLGVGSTGAVVLLPTIPVMERWYNGALVLIPGSNLTIQTSAASGASGMLCEYIWEELPI
jgi:hypothetical protein